MIRHTPDTTRLRRAALALALCGVAMPSLAGAAPRSNSLAKVPREVTAQAAATGEARVLVGLAIDTRTEGSLSKAATKRQRAAIAAAQERLLDELGNTQHQLGRRYEIIPYLALTVSPEALDQLRRSKRVRGVFPDRQNQTSLVQSVPLVGGSALHAAGINGAGTAVAILDSGTEATHPFFGGRVVDEACFSNNGSCPNGATTQFGAGAAQPCVRQISGCNHGTHVAGIAAGALGVAPGANIVAINVFSNFSGTDCGEAGGECITAADSDIIAGLERVFATRAQYNIVAANMSLGGGRFFASCDAEAAPMKAIIDQLLAVGVATPIASGNETLIDSLGSPACITSGVTVGSTTKTDTISDFSNSHPLVDLLATGSDIESSVTNGQFESQSGTSMATPHVAGAWALLRQASPTASVSQVLAALQSTGRVITDTRNGLSRPRIQVDAARSALAAPNGGGTPLVLQGGRFKVNVAWRNPIDGSQGFGIPLPRTDLAGYFAFTDPNNIELIVKILDFGSIKVFYSQLTDLQFTMTVTDTTTGRVKHYGNTPGNCGAIDQDYAGANVLATITDPLADAAALESSQLACAAGANTLCLADGRFQLTMTWRNQFSGTSGLGGAVPLSNLTGQFFFSDATNIEILTKVLVFGERVLFFYGALSDLEFEITVTDMVTGRVKNFSNPAGNYCGGNDTNF